MANIKDHVSVIREGQDLLPGGEGQDFWPPHAPTHQEGGSDVINVQGLLGTLADPQNAGWIHGRGIAVGAPSDGDVLIYELSSDSWIYAPPTPGALIWTRDSGGGFLYPVTTTDSVRVGSGSAVSPGYAFVSGGDSGFFWDSHPAFAIDGLKVWDFEYTSNVFSLTSNYWTRIISQYNGGVANSFAVAEFGSLAASDFLYSYTTLYSENQSGGALLDLHVKSGGVSSGEMNLYADSDGTDIDSSVAIGCHTNGTGLRYLFLGGYIQGTLRYFDSIRFGVRSLNSAPGWTLNQLEFCEPGNTSQWTDYKNNFGETSLVQALNKAYAEGGATLTQYAVGFGSASSLLTGDAANFFYNSNRQLFVGTGSPTYLGTDNDCLYVNNKVEIGNSTFFGANTYNDASYHVLNSTEGLKMTGVTGSEYLEVSCSAPIYESAKALFYGENAKIELLSVDLSTESASASISLHSYLSASATVPQIEIMAGGSIGDGKSGTVNLSSYALNIDTVSVTSFKDGYVQELGLAINSKEKVLSISSGVLESHDWREGAMARVNVTENITSQNFTTPTNITWNFRASMLFRFDGSYTVTGFDSNVDFVSGTTLPIAGTAGQKYLVEFEYRGNYQTYFATVFGPF
jgi:hypothetical protein